MGLPDAGGRGQCVTEDALVPEASEAMHHLSRAVQHLPVHLVLSVGRAPVPRLDEGDLAGAHVAVLVGDDVLSVVLQRPVLSQDVVDARHHLVPFIVVVVSGQSDVHRSTGDDFQRLPPELVLPSLILPEGEVLGLGVAGGDGRVMTDLNKTQDI